MRNKLFAALACAPLLLNSLAGSVVASEPRTGKIEPIKNFPEAESLTQRIHGLPNPFLSWEGTPVTPAAWPARSAQLGQIMQHYETGYLPSTEGISVSLAITRAQSSYTAAA